VGKAHLPFSACSIGSSPPPRRGSAAARAMINFKFKLNFFWAGPGVLIHCASWPRLSRPLLNGPHI
jgi:hypothetical protein